MHIVSKPRWFDTDGDRVITKSNLRSTYRFTYHAEGLTCIAIEQKTNGYLSSYKRRPSCQVPLNVRLTADKGSPVLVSHPNFVTCRTFKRTNRHRPLDRLGCSPASRRELSKNDATDLEPDCISCSHCHCSTCCP